MEKTLNLNQFKAGDDFKSILDQSSKKDYVSALRKHASLLRQDADSLEKLAGLIELLPDEKRKDISVRGDSHIIGISGPKDFLAILTRWKLVE